MNETATHLLELLASWSKSVFSVKDNTRTDNERDEAIPKAQGKSGRHHAGYANMDS